MVCNEVSVHRLLRKALPTIKVSTTGFAGGTDSVFSLLYSGYGIKAIDELKTGVKSYNNIQD